MVEGFPSPLAPFFFMSGNIGGRILTLYQFHILYIYISLIEDNKNMAHKQYLIEDMRGKSAPEHKLLYEVMFLCQLYLKFS